MSLPTLVFVPGLLCTQALYAAQIAALSATHTIHVIDHTQHNSMQAIAQHALHTITGNFAVVGLSMGGYVAMELYRQAAPRITHFALLDTTHLPDSATALARRSGLIKAAQAGRFAGVTQRMLPELLHPNNVHNPAITQPIFDMTRSVGYAGFVNQQQAIMARIDSTHTLQQVSCPAMVLCGEADSLTPPAIASQMAQLMPHASLHIIANAGHLPPLEQPDVVTALLSELLQR